MCLYCQLKKQNKETIGKPSENRKDNYINIDPALTILLSSTYGLLFVEDRR